MIWLVNSDGRKRTGNGSSTRGEHQSVALFGEKLRIRPNKVSGREKFNFFALLAYALIWVTFSGNIRCLNPTSTSFCPCDERHRRT